MRLLCHFSQHIRYNAFRIEELEALAAEENVDLTYLWQEDSPRPSSTSSNVFVFCHLPDEKTVIRIQNKSILIKSFIEVWSDGKDHQTVLENLHLKASNYIEAHLKGKKWAYKFIAFNRSINQSQIEEIMKTFTSIFADAGEVDLVKPETLICVSEDWQNLGEDRPRLVRTFFGRVIVQRIQKEAFWNKYKLSKRSILGPTTLDNELSFLMCNQAGVKPNMIILDPFVGTGSILIAATHLGATCIGSDIDVRVLKGWGISYKNTKTEHGKEERTDVFQNFINYQLPLPDIIRADSAHSVWRGHKSYIPKDQNTISNGIKNVPWVDAIITDPPYGIRAGARTTSNSGLHNTVIRESDYIFPTSWYNSRDTIEDLLNLSSKLLIENGKLVFLLLVETELASKQLEELKHPDFELISASPQILPAKRSRFLVTMRRLAHK